PPPRAESQTGVPELQPGAVPPSVDGRQTSHWPLPRLAPVSQSIAPVQPAVPVHTLQLCVAPATTQTGSGAVQPRATPPSVEGMQVLQLPPSTAVSQTRPLPQPPRPVHVTHEPRPVFRVGSQTGNCPPQPGSAAPPVPVGAQLRHWPMPPLALVSQMGVPVVQPRLTPDPDGKVPSQFRQTRVAVSQNWLAGQAGLQLWPPSGPSLQTPWSQTWPALGQSVETVHSRPQLHPAKVSTAEAVNSARRRTGERKTTQTSGKGDNRPATLYTFACPESTGPLGTWRHSTWRRSPSRAW